MKISIRSLLFSIVFVALSGCGGGGGGDTPTPDTPLTLDEIANSVRSLDISGASRIMLTGDTVTAANTDDAIKTMAAGDPAVTMDPNSIYKVTTDGRLVRVGVIDTDGTELPRGTVKPTAIKEINAQFLLLTLQITTPDPDPTLGMANTDSVNYLVHKGTGYAYKSSGVINSPYSVDQIPDYLFSLGIATDDAGPTNPSNGSKDFSTVYKIDISALGASTLTATSVQNIDAIHDYQVSSDGKSLVYHGTTRADYSQQVFRYLNLSTSVISNIPSSYGTDLAVTNKGVFKGLNGQIYMNKSYASTSSSTGTPGRRVSRIGQDTNGALIQTDIGEWIVTKQSTGFNSASYTSDWIGGSDTAPYVISGKQVYLKGGQNGSSNDYFGTYTVSPEQATILEHDAPANLLSNIRDTQVSSNFIFYFGVRRTTGSDVILRYNPATYATKIFTAGTDIDINRYRILNTNVIWFEGIRLSDSATLIGEIAEDGTVTITDTVAGTEPPVIDMEAITPADFIFINGDYQDWATSLRIKTDAASDATAGHDLTFYSQTQSSSQYFGLVEFNNDSISNTNAATIITIDNMYELRIEENSGTFKTLGGATVDLRSTGALYSIGKAVEFSVPLSQLSGAAFTSLAINRVSTELFGDVSAVVAPKVGTDFEVDITMSTPLGDAEVIIFLDTVYTLRFTKNTAVINNGTVDTNLVDIAGASITYPGTDGDNITAIIPETAIGSPGAITPTEQSTPQTLDVTQDVM